MSFFGKLTPVLFCSRNKIIVSGVGGGKNPSRKLIFEQSIDYEAPDHLALEKALTKAMQQLGDRRWHVLIADELSYLLELSVPKDVNYTREYVSDFVLSEVPEELTDLDWDFKQTGVDAEKNQQVLIFAPVQKSWQVLKNLFKKLHIEVVAVECESMAKSRHGDAWVGIVKKTDLSGPDKNVLNIQVGKNWRPLFNYLLLGLLVVGGMLITAFVTVVLLRRGSMIISSSKPDQGTSQIVASPIPSSAPDLVDTATASADLSAYSVQILNASGVAGVAGDLDKILVSEGFNQASLGNAPVVASASSVIRVKKSVAESVVKNIELVLSNFTDQVIAFETLSENSRFDILILITKKD